MLPFPPLQVASVLVLFHYTCMAETMFVVQHKNYKADFPVGCKIKCAHICFAIPSCLITIYVRWRGVLCVLFDLTPVSNSDSPVLKLGDDLPWWGMLWFSSVPSRISGIILKFGHGRFLLHYFQCLIHRSSHHYTTSSLSYNSREWWGASWLSKRFLSYSRNSQRSMQPSGLLPRSQEPVTGPCSGSDECGLHPPNLYLEDTF